MFEKLLSLLPYNPGLAGQMAFYSRRMREEASIRRTGMVFIVLAFLIQFVAVISPPQSTLAASNNNLITDGISSAADAKQQCLNDTRGYQRIMHYYGISCAKFDSATVHDIGNVSQGGQDYYSLGHNPVGNTYNGKSTDEHSVSIDGAGTLYWRRTTIWNTSSWHVLQVTNNQGKTFYIIYDCGNLMTVGVPGQSQLASSEDTISGGTVVTQPSAPTPAPVSTPAAPAPVSTPPHVDTTTTVPSTAVAHDLCRFVLGVYADSPDCPAACPFNASIPVTDTAKCFCQYNNSIPPGDENCKPCQKSTNSQDTVACIEVSKAAANVTAGVADANNTTAKAGDVITYTLYAKNNGKGTVKGFVFQENISDVLDYADINDFHGGVFDNSSKLISWPAQDIQPNATAKVQVTVKVKDPIPQTPVSSSDPTHFDLKMVNVYGNVITINLPGSPAKTVQAAATALPNTGPGTSLLIGGTFVMIGGYFYGRARLLAKESKLALRETAGA